MATGDNTLTGLFNAQKWCILNCNQYLTGRFDKNKKAIIWEFKYIRAEDLESSGYHSILSEEEDSESELVLDVMQQIYTQDEKDFRIKDSSQALRDFMANSSGEIEAAMEGSAFQYLLKLRDRDWSVDGFLANEVLSEILKRGKVFSRMSPKQKALLVEEYQKATGEMVGMCGDGANDCSALKAADVGLSLSETEASIVAPFTSKTQDISSCVNLLILGRASLDLSYELFKYLMVYIQIQFGSVMILLFKTWNYSDEQFLFFDMGGVVPITILLWWTQANNILINKRPVGSLFKRSILFDVIGQGQIQFWWFFGIYFTLRGQGFYEETRGSHDETVDGHESTTAFLFTFPQYIFIGIAFHTATQFRQPIYTNVPFMLILILQLCLAGWMILGPLTFMKDTFGLAHLDFYFRVVILGGAIVNGILTIAFEQFIIRVFGKKEMEEEIIFSKKIKSNPTEDERLFHLKRD
jgi:cation-transporting P-type ATPase 13A2